MAPHAGHRKRICPPGLYEALNSISAELPAAQRSRVEAAAKLVFQAKAAIMAEMMG